MSDQSEMSLLKKVTDKITDEVSLATNKIQNMQIIDHLSSTIGQPSKILSSQPDQILPEPQKPTDDSYVDGHQSLSDINHFSLIDSGHTIDFSGNHNLDELAADSDFSPQHQLFNNQAIIPLTASNSSSSSHVSPLQRLDDSNNINSRNSKHKDEQAPSDGHHGQTSKANLLAKFKESLRLKNSQIKVLKDSLGQVERFKMYADELRGELDELRASHETWTVSIAENKRTMHEEMEAKNGDIRRLQTEADCLQIRLKDSQMSIKQLKSRIQDLESRLVSTSVAHQKERESLTKELNTAKNNAIKQLHKEHELNVERVKLEFEKSIEALKSDILSRDLRLIEDAKHSKQLLDINSDLTEKVADLNRKLEDNQAEIDSLKRRHVEEIEKFRPKATPGDGHKEELDQVKLEYDKLKEEAKISAELANDKFESITSAIKQQESEIEMLKSEISRKDLHLDEHTKQSQQSLDLINGLERKIADFSQQLIDKQTEIDTLRWRHDEELKSKATSCDAITNELKQLKIEVKAIKANLEDANCKLESSANVIEEFEKEMDLLRSERQTLTDRCQKLQLEFDQSKASYDNITMPVQESYSNSTEFEYLKNIVYQFMLGREPLVLARVISAVFKFDPNQVEQVCKVQEAIQSATRHLASS